jgi:D-alanyl-D-alanine carboxypeptidase
MLCENKIRYTLLFSLLLLINNNKIFKKKKSNKILDYIFSMLSIKNMTIWKKQVATDQVQQEDQAVVSASTMTAVKTVMTKIAAQNLHAPVEHQMAFHTKNLQCYLGEWTEWNIL